MIRITKVFEFVALVALANGLTGCAGLDRLDSKLDMAAGHVTEQNHREFEGRIEAVERVGAMTAIQFEGGQQYAVIEAPPALVRGDIVRIYKTEKGLEAHLWRAREDQTFVPKYPKEVPHLSNRS